MGETRAGRVGPAAGFWITAAVFLATMSFTTIPTPLYADYQARDGFPSWVVTVIFAAYAVGVAAALYLVGHQGDRLGRRPVVLAAVALEAVASAVFLADPAVPALLVARLVSGLGVGLLTASATAQLAELHGRWRGDGLLPGAVATVANIGGLGLGPLVGGALAEWAPAPLRTPWIVYLVVFVLAAGITLLVPETVRRATTLPAYRPQRVTVPPEARRAFWSAGAAVFAAFGVFGLFSSVAPGVLSREFGVTSPLAAGGMTAAVLLAGAVAQLALLRIPLPATLATAVAAMVGGLVGLALGAALHALVLFVAGGVVAGAGVGLVFRACLGLVGALAPAEARGETLAGLFLLAYLGLIAPVLAVGIAIAALPPVPVLAAFAGLVALLVLIAGVRLRRATA